MPDDAVVTKPVQFVIADDHGVVRRGLRSIIELQSNWMVVGEASTGRAAVTLAREAGADVVLMDIAMPDLNGIEATRAIVAERPQTRVIVITMHETDAMIEAALSAGACAILQKNDASELLVPAINAALEHRPYFSPGVSRLLISGFLRQTHPPADGSGSRLTTRQREILQLIAEGHSTKDVARLLDMSIKTAETHRTNLMKRIGAKSVAELVRYAIRNGVVQP